MELLPILHTYVDAKRYNSETLLSSVIPHSDTHKLTAKTFVFKIKYSYQSNKTDLYKNSQNVFINVNNLKFIKISSSTSTVYITNSQFPIIKKGIMKIQLQ